MQTVKGCSWLRLVGAFVAFFCVAGSGIVYAGAPSGAGYPAPRSGVLEGPAAVGINSVSQYELVVTYVDGSTSSFTGPPATFTASAASGPSGSFLSGTAKYHAPGAANRILLKAVYSSPQGGITVNRVITVH